MSVVDSPQDERPETGKHVGDCIQSARFGHSFWYFFAVFVEHGRTFSLRGFKRDFRRVGIFLVNFRVM